MLKLRIVTGSIIAVVFLATLLASSPFSLALLALLVLAGASWEWARMSRINSGFSLFLYVLLQLGLFTPFVLTIATSTPPSMVVLSGDFVLATPLTILLYLSGVLWLGAALAVLRHPGAPASWLNDLSVALIGIVVLLAAVVSLLIVRISDFGKVWILYCVAVVAAADIGAYFSGRRWGKRKLAASVSPGKSWEGFWGGLFSAQLVAFAFYFGWGAEMIDSHPNGSLYLFMLITLLLSCASVFGDLFESLLKRRVAMKDSSRLLPGHGGVLDRIDSLIAALPVLVICQRLLGWQ